MDKYPFFPPIFGESLDKFVNKARMKRVFNRE
jgi:hypothetical protein